MFKFLTKNDQIVKDGKKTEQLAARQTSTELATSVAFVTLAESGSIDDITATEHTDLFSPWVENVAYKAGDLRQYENNLYRCVQAHTSQADWTPDATASLWTKVGDPTEEYPEWSQPIGSHDAYAMGDKVSYDNKKWVSTIDANVWQPGVYGWNEV
ncbi:MAG: alpha-amlyase [Clostridiales bacterium]|nr:alpha-amlyase [Clostridiales bacterium]